MNRCGTWGCGSVVGKVGPSDLRGLFPLNHSLSQCCDHSIGIYLELKYGDSKEPRNQLLDWHTTEQVTCRPSRSIPTLLCFPQERSLHVVPPPGCRTHLKLQPWVPRGLQPLQAGLGLQQEGSPGLLLPWGSRAGWSLWLLWLQGALPTEAAGISSWRGLGSWSCWHGGTPQVLPQPPQGGNPPQLREDLL